VFTITEIESARAATILHGFIERIDADREIFAHHRPRSLSYDNTATLTYEGTIVRGGGAEGSMFHIAKGGSFMVIIYAPEPDEFLPSITVVGDFH
jgi:hypothetical protein